MIILEDIVKSYKGVCGPVEALKGVSLRLEKGGFMAVTGSSGSGKTTLMNIIGCLDRPQSGRYLLDGRDVSGLGDRELSRVRSLSLGFIFQGFNLISGMTALENVMLPLAIRGVPRDERKRLAASALETVGLGDRMSHRPGRLSGGQQQRVAVARVIACRTPLILADEPTGNLDPQSTREIMGILSELNQTGVTVLLITHDLSVAAMVPRRAVMDGGRLEVIS